MTLLFVILLWLIFLAAVANALRRLPYLPGLSVAAGLSLLAERVWNLSPGETIKLLGRSFDPAGTNSFLGFSFAFSDPARSITLIILAWGILFALAAAWTQADHTLIPAIPLISAILLLALSTSPLLWAPIWLVVLAILMAFPAQSAAPRLARPALRTLLAPTLAFPFFLFAAWVFNQPAIAIDDPKLWLNAWRALVVGLGLLLTPVPLHGWITALGEHAPPFTAAFLVGIWQIAIYAFVRQTLFAYPLIADYADPGQWLPWLAVMQMLWAGLFALGSNRLGQFWGYLLLFDFGATFLLWSISGEFGTQSMIWLFLARPLLLVLAAAGLQTLSRRLGETATYTEVGGASERLPLAALSLLAGGFFLAGWPLGALFPARLTTFYLAEATQSGFFLAAMLAVLLLTLGLIRVLRALTQPLADPKLQREPAHLPWLILPLLLLGLLLSLNPAILDPITGPLTDWLMQI